jgi:hypothetical protein
MLARTGQRVAVCQRSEPRPDGSLSQPDSIIDKLRAGDGIKALGVVIEICHDDRRPTIRLNLSDIRRPMHRYARAILLHAAQFAGSSQKDIPGAHDIASQPAFAVRRKAFRALHEHGCFVIPNPWDVGSARYLQHLGFPALATSSAGFAFSQGLPDSGDAVISRDRTLGYISSITAAVDLPVSADFLSGYGRHPEDVAESVTRCVTTGVAGLSIEDATGDPASPMYELSVAVERVGAARRAIPDRVTLAKNRD